MVNCSDIGEGGGRTAVLSTNYKKTEGPSYTCVDASINVQAAF